MKLGVHTPRGVEGEKIQRTLQSYSSGTLECERSGKPRLALDPPPRAHDPPRGSRRRTTYSAAFAGGTRDRQIFRRLR